MVEDGRYLVLDRFSPFPMLAIRMTSLAKSILTAKKQRGIALMPFIAAGYPNLVESMKLLPALERGGAAGVEIGFPFSEKVGVDGMFLEDRNRGAQLLLRDLSPGSLHIDA